MQNTLKALIDQAIEQCNLQKYPGAEAVINGKTVEARIVEQYRRTALSRKKQKPSVMWKIDGKRIAAAELEKAIAK